MPNLAKINTELDFVVQLIEDNELEDELGEAFSSVLINPAVTWAKFILTDDRPNGNKQRIPSSEFPNLMRSGLYMPVKMAKGEIKDGHESAEPLGVITHLRQTGNKIVALAALWARERTADIEYIRGLIEKGAPVNISWEILFGEAELKEGIMDLKDTVLRAATIVGMPAYEGRTPILAIAAKKWSPPYIASLPDNAFLVVQRPLQEGGKNIRHFAYKDVEGNIDPTRFPIIKEEMGVCQIPQNELKKAIQTLKKLETKFESGASISEVTEEFRDAEPIAADPNSISEAELETTKELENKIQTLTEELATANAALAELRASVETANAALLEANSALETLKAELTQKEEELASLKEFKASVDAENERKNKLDEIKSKFMESGIEKPDAFFDENAESLLAMDESSLGFFIQEMVSFSKEGGESSKEKTKIPNFTNDETRKLDAKELGRALRQKKAN